MLWGCVFHGKITGHLPWTMLPAYCPVVCLSYRGIVLHAMFGHDYIHYKRKSDISPTRSPVKWGTLVSNVNFGSKIISCIVFTLVTGLWCTLNVWNNCGPWPTVSGCWTITLTSPWRVPYAISIQLPHRPVKSFHVIDYHATTSSIQLLVVFGVKYTEMAVMWSFDGSLYNSVTSRSLSFIRNGNFCMSM